ncbi:kinesin family protein-like protein [Lentithecium fluviatile CBS 122367]|uniref:Kinesin family protein-like protein n=1 Tax=Lentithecium fluviatile CBS 122367 TaxID=1168545 RepID=A0A6G1JB51_9PLEO|nr:kinesin family protein-like protein [Lentithecium fluviatile CBS 122367]
MSVRVIARIRPLLKHELDKDSIVTAESSTDGDCKGRPTIVRLPNPKNPAESFSFQFNSVFEQDATQQEIFDAEISPTVKHLFNGFDLSIFAHGCTGTGKTHTMRGGKALADRGVIPRLLSAIFRRCKKIEKDSSGATQVTVRLEYFEIYCERVYDLFEPPEKRTPSGLPIRDNNRKTVVVGLTEKPCATLKDFEQLYDQANINRSTSATKLNAHSSRSHAVLGVKVTQTTETTIRVSRASCIDLAGSEDNRRTDNSTERLKESNAINSSLFTLANCVDAINSKAPRIPYRESKLTRILSLGQNGGRTIMILNLAPTRAYHLDTVSSLSFASRTKKIEVSEIENDPIYRTMAKPLAATSSIGGTTINRQPLRPLTAAHNAIKQEVDPKKQGTRPVKAFSVYSDTRKAAVRTSHAPTQNQGLRKPESHKRPAESNTAALRPFKKSTDYASRMRNTEPVLTKESIDALISQRIDEKLTERALQDAGAVPKLSTEVQKRLDDLEHRIVAKEDDEKGQGLQYLLMAKQHTIRGEDTSALRMYQLAMPFFPGNGKLRAKMDTLKERIRSKKMAGLGIRMGSESTRATATVSASSANLMGSLKGEKKPTKIQTEYKDESDDEFAPPLNFDHDESYASDSSFKYTKAVRKPKNPAKKLPIFRDFAGEEPSGGHTPRTVHVLNIINSRDVGRIKTLVGVGAKKAEGIVSSLLEMEDEEVLDLAGLAKLKGVGGKTAETMRMGIKLG